MPLLLPLSPSSALSDPERIKKITAKIIPPYKFHYQHALITSDPRQLDLIAASYINGMVRYLDGRLLEARTEIGLAVSLVWATGIGKLGMVGEDLTKNMGDKDRQGFISRRIGTREDLSDAFVHRSTSIEPPTDLVEYDRRVKLLYVLAGIRCADEENLHIVSAGRCISWTKRFQSVSPDQTRCTGLSAHPCSHKSAFV
jgi:hypothetical protein